MDFTTGREFSIAPTMNNLTLTEPRYALYYPQRVLIGQPRATNLHGLILKYDIRSILFKNHWWFEIMDLLKLRR